MSERKIQSITGGVRIQPVAKTPDVREADLVAIGKLCDIFNAWCDEGHDYVTVFSFMSMAHETYNTVVQPLIEAAYSKGLFEGYKQGTDETVAEMEPEIDQARKEG